MKANRKFVEADEAVSPVIAVILMVAITVVLAATVFVLVSDIGSNTAKNAPQMGWADDESADSFSVTQAPTQILWKDFKIKGPAATATVEIVMAWNAAPVDGGCTLAASYVPTSGDNTAAATSCENSEADLPDDAAATASVVSGGDFFEFCNGIAATDATNVQITILHAVSNAISHEFTFSTVAAC